MITTPTQKSVIIVAGPTAVGKTSVAIQLAKYFNTEIISADSRQCYKELKIGVARPPDEILREVPHHFIASHSIQDVITAAGFEKFALDKVKELFKTHDIVIMVGGTGLYIKAFCEGLDEIPAIDPEISREIQKNFEEKGLSWLQDEIKKKDPGYYKVGEIKNPQRMMRALEVKQATGRSVLDFRKGLKAKRDFNIIKIGLELPKEQLHQNINNRVDKMMEEGLLEEVRKLLPYKNLNALQTVGYTELFDHLDGKSYLEEAVRLIKQNTRRYAKRQLTWFRKDKEIRWFEPRELAEIFTYLGESMSAGKAGKR
jgi:tRNA dimethylallyltransferase